MRVVSLLVFASALTAYVSVAASDKIVLGYFTNWSQYRVTGERYAFTPEDIDATKFTHIVYSFALINSANNVYFPESNDPSFVQRFQDHVHGQNPSVRTLIGVGGWNFGGEQFSILSEHSTSRAVFITSLISVARANNFDGIDIDWEFPTLTSQGGRPVDKPNFTLLLQDLRTAIDSETVPAGKSRLLLSIAVSNALNVINSAYELDSIGDPVDWIGIMSYDLYDMQGAMPHTAWRGNSNHTVLEGLTLWMEHVPANKLVLGIGAYGRTFTLKEPPFVRMGQAVSGPGQMGVVTRELGFMSYFEIMQLAASTSSPVKFDSSTETAYLTYNDFFVGFDTPETVELKTVQAMQLGLRGLMVWSADLDDFNNGNPITTAVVTTMCGFTSVSICNATKSLPQLPQFNDLDLTLGSFKGTLSFRLPHQATNITKFSVYYGDSASRKGQSVATVRLADNFNNGNSFVQIGLCSTVSLFASAISSVHIVSLDRADNEVATTIVSIVDKVAPTVQTTALSFIKRGDGSVLNLGGQIVPIGFRGTVVFQRPASEFLATLSYVAGYRVYAATGTTACSRFLPPLAVLNSATLSEASRIVSADTEHLYASHIQIVPFNSDGEGPSASIQVANSFFANCTNGTLAPTCVGGVVFYNPNQPSPSPLPPSSSPSPSPAPHNSTMGCSLECVTRAICNNSTAQCCEMALCAKCDMCTKPPSKSSLSKEKKVGIYIGVGAAGVVVILFVIRRHRMNTSRPKKDGKGKRGKGNAAPATAGKTVSVVVPGGAQGTFAPAQPMYASNRSMVAPTPGQQGMVFSGRGVQNGMNGQPIVMHGAGAVHPHQGPVIHPGQQQFAHPLSIAQQYPQHQQGNPQIHQHPQFQTQPLQTHAPNQPNQQPHLPNQPQAQQGAFSKSFPGQPPLHPVQPVGGMNSQLPGGVIASGRQQSPHPAPSQPQNTAAGAQRQGGFTPAPTL